jgi:hypothetical protein
MTVLVVMLGSIEVMVTIPASVAPVMIASAPAIVAPVVEGSPLVSDGSFVWPVASGVESCVRASLRVGCSSV